MRLEDRVALITGAGQGMGRAYAERMIKEGAKVAVADINPEQGERVAAELSELGEACYFDVDIADEASAKTCAEAVVRQFGRIDILLNNAAIYDTLNFADQSLEYLRKVYHVNLNGAWVMTNAVSPFMVEASYGRIINVASTTAYLYTTAMAPADEFQGLDSYAYPMSKWGILGLSKFMAGQLGRYNITVNTIVPGFTLSEASKKFTGPDGSNEFIEAVSQITPMQIGAFQPEDMTGTAVFFASDDARYVTAQMIVVDGGMVSPS